MISAGDNARLVQASGRAKKYREAEKAYRQALKLNPFNADYFACGLFYDGIKKWTTEAQYLVVQMQLLKSNLVI